MRLVSIIVLALTTGCVSPVTESLELVFEFRAPQTLKFEPLTKIDLSTDCSVSGTRLHAAKRTDDGVFSIFRRSFLIFSDEKRRALIVSVDDARPSQVFILPIPKKPQLSGWTEWARPNYVAGPDATWLFMHGTTTGDSSSIPIDSFELRYRINPK